MEGSNESGGTPVEETVGKAPPRRGAAPRSRTSEERGRGTPPVEKPQNLRDLASVEFGVGALKHQVAIEGQQEGQEVIEQSSRREAGKRMTEEKEDWEHPRIKTITKRIWQQMIMRRQAP